MSSCLSEYQRFVFVFVPLLKNTDTDPWTGLYVVTVLFGCDDSWVAADDHDDWIHTKKQS
jgi:hypothetical protein